MWREKCLSMNFNALNVKTSLKNWSLAVKQTRFAAQNVIATRFKDVCHRSLPEQAQDKQQNPMLHPVEAVDFPEQLNASGLKQNKRDARSGVS